MIPSSLPEMIIRSPDDHKNIRVRNIDKEITEGMWIS